MRRFATNGLSPRIAALIRRADGAAAEAAAPVGGSAAGSAPAGASTADAAPSVPPAVAARAALVARNSAALAQLRGMLGVAAPASQTQRRPSEDAESGDGDDSATLLRDVRDITTRARRGDQVCSMFLGVRAGALA
jgi:hypothetical protein